LPKQLSTLGVFNKFRIVIIGFVIAVAVLTYVFFSSSAPTYSVKTKIFVSSTVNSAIANIYDAPYTDRAVKTISALITNETVLADISEQTGLSKDDVKKSIKSRYIIGTQIIEITVTGKDTQVISSIASFYPDALSGYLSTIQQTTDQKEKISIAVAESPTDPTQVSFKIWQIVLMGALGALVLGVCIAYLVELLDSSIHSSKDFTEININHLGDFGVMKKLTADSPITNQQNVFVAEMLREIRTNITSLKANIKSITVTSANPKEGKSIFISSLAILLAEAKKRVVIIDADLRSPSIHKIFNIANKVGLGDYLKGKCKAEEAIIRTDFKNLFLVTAGVRVGDPSESLSQPELEAFIKWLTEEFGADYILIDTPPLGMITDAAIISKKTDGTVFVAEEGKTTKGDLRRVQNAIERVSGKVIGAVLTKAKGGAKRIYGYI